MESYEYDSADAMWSKLVTRNSAKWRGVRSVCTASGKLLVEVDTVVDVNEQQVNSGQQQTELGFMLDDPKLLWSTEMVDSPEVSKPMYNKSASVKVAISPGNKSQTETWTFADIEDLAVVFEDGSFSIGPTAMMKEDCIVQHGIVDGDLRVRSIHAFDWERKLAGVTICRERKQESSTTAKPNYRDSGIVPAAWRSPSALIQYSLGLWKGSGWLYDEKQGKKYPINSTWNLISSSQFNDVVLRTSIVIEERGYEAAAAAATNDQGPASSTLEDADEANEVLRAFRKRGGPMVAMEQTPSSRRADSVANGSSEETLARGEIDNNVILFPSVGVYCVALNGGVLVSQPIQFFGGSLGSIETSFLVKPNLRKRIIRCYNESTEWIYTAFLMERLVS